jgi:hypothetical protein
MSDRQGLGQEFGFQDHVRRRLISRNLLDLQRNNVHPERRKDFAGVNQRKFLSFLSIGSSHFDIVLAAVPAPRGIDNHLQIRPATRGK